MFLDASAIVAISTSEEEADSISNKILSSSGPIYYSSITMFEAVIAVARKTAVALHGDQRHTPPEIIIETQKDVEDFLRRIGAVEIPLSAGLHQTALQAARTYGRFVGHPARLNFGDCFSYAAAKELKSSLLFVGKDFSQTDIEAA